MFARRGSPELSMQCDIPQEVSPDQIPTEGSQKPEGAPSVFKPMEGKLGSLWIWPPLCVVGTALAGAAWGRPAALASAALCAAMGISAVARVTRSTGLIVAALCLLPTALLFTVLSDSSLSLGASGPSLAGADLRGADLRGADMRGIDLSGANLSGACLRGARLRGAVLRGVDFWGADVEGAEVDEPDLVSARNWGLGPSASACP